MYKLFKILLVVILMFVLSGCYFIVVKEHSNNEISDYPPMVMFNGSLYIGAICEKGEKAFVEVGEIKDYITYGIPTLNNQANDPLMNCKIFIAEDFPEYIFVLKDNVYMPYKKE